MRFYCTAKIPGTTTSLLVDCNIIDLTLEVNVLCTDLQNEEGVTLSHKARLFLVGMIPIEYLLQL